MTQAELIKAKKLYKRARRLYYNDEPIMTDAEFDALEDQIKAVDPEWSELHKTGVRSADKKTDTDLERFMPSLEKIYPEDTPKWIVRPIVQAATQVLIMDKLDGTSLQLIYDKKKPVRLITRGDGAIGGDISFMLPWLVDYGVIPASIPISARMVFRCEALMTKTKFSKLWSTKAKGENGFVSGTATPTKGKEIGNNSPARRAETVKEIAILAKFPSLEQDYKAWKLKYQTHRDNCIAYGKNSELEFRDYLRLAKRAGITSPAEIGKKIGLLQLARHGDTGPYNLDNCRFIPMEKNQEELTENGGRAKATAGMVEQRKKYFIATRPSGESTHESNINEFARENGLQASCIVNVLKGDRPHHKRWTFRYEDAPEVKPALEKGQTDRFKNARNMVNGLFNRRDKHPALKHVSMVVLGVYGMAARAGLKWANEVGFESVVYSVESMDKLSADYLTTMLERARRMSAYEMDGLVLMDTRWVYEYDRNEKPKHIPIAFKVNAEDSAPEVELLSLIWQKTRTGRWQPVFEIPPTELDGAIVTRVTGNNPQWLLERGVGVGGVVKVLRSGGVIPKIVGVVKKAKLTLPPGPYKVKGAYWMIDGEREDPMVKVRAIHHMLVTLGVENVAEKTVIKLHDCGLFKTKGAYITWKSEPRSKRLGRLQTKAGLGPRQAEIVDEQIVNAMSKTIPLRTLMVASGFFDGIGDRKLRAIEDHGIGLILFLRASPQRVRELMINVGGFQKKTVDKLIEGFKEFDPWYSKSSLYLDVDESLPEKKKSVTGVLTGKKVCFTGYRDKEQAAVIESQGGNIVTSFSGSTDILLYSAQGKKSTKVDKAGDRAYTWHQLRAKFGF